MTQLMCNFYVSFVLLIFFFLSFFFGLAVIIKEGVYLYL